MAYKGEEYFKDKIHLFCKQGNRGGGNQGKTDLT